MTIIIILGLMLIASTALYCFFYSRIPNIKIFAFKLFTSFCFLSLAACCYIFKSDKSTSYDTLIMLGIISGFIGDVLLGFRNMFPNRKHLFFVIGISFFLIGHILYIAAMASHKIAQIPIVAILAIGFFIVGVVFTKFTKVDFGKAFIVDYVYILISSIFLSLTLINAINLVSLNYYIIFLGVASFVTSDMILSYLYFSKVNPKLRRILKLINIGTYYFGQMVLALSILMF